MMGKPAAIIPKSLLTPVLSRRGERSLGVEGAFPSPLAGEGTGGEGLSKTQFPDRA